ncbi:NAD(P)-binding protein [Schizophyllum commune H4-8]|nr:NAD(P)-binding protein [Schizophyllum commune H4-8]KAI5894734.1 NAD(P)-binding protein [Schizophyllum commune H4-8]
MATAPRVWLITGTTSGLGKRLVNEVLSRGDLVIATGRSIDNLKAQYEESDQLKLMQLDVTEGPQPIAAKVQEALSVWGRIDVLVNNAGIGYPSLIEEAGSALLRKQMEANLYGVVDVTLAVLPHLRERKAGTIVVVGSRSAYKTELIGVGIYGASKAAVTAWTESLANEAALFNVKVMLVQPGSFRTEGMYGQGFYNGNQIPAWNDIHATARARFASVPGTEKGDPAKAMRALVDVVRGEGKAAGRALPRYLVLGEDAVADVRNKFARVLQVVADWEDVSTDVNFD